MTRANFNSLESLIGKRLVGVKYHYLPAADTHEYAGTESGFDSDLAAIDLDFGERGTTIITWATDGMNQGLANLNGESYTGLATEVLDAADRDAWGMSIGDRISTIAVAWHFSGDDCPESIWAVRIGFSVSSIVIALGTANQEIDYMPDELVVVFDETLARLYRPASASEICSRVVFRRISGGDLLFQDSIDESVAFSQLEDLLIAVEPPPFLLCA